MPTSTDTTLLFRPTGQRELDLIRASGWRAFPPRLDWQPIFYPVLNEEYAIQIARDWNTRDAFSGNVGYVVRFAVRTDFLAEFPIQTVGARQHVEYWIPAERLIDFNNAIVGLIELIHEFKAQSHQTDAGC